MTRASDFLMSRHKDNLIENNLNKLTQEQAHEYKK